MQTSIKDLRETLQAQLPEQALSASLAHCFQHVLQHGFQHMQSTFQHMQTTIKELRETLRTQCVGYFDRKGSRAAAAAADGEPPQSPGKSNATQTRGGVARTPEEAALSCLIGNRFTQLGTFGSEDAAALAYDEAAIAVFRLEARPNWPIVGYAHLLSASLMPQPSRLVPHALFLVPCFACLAPHALP